MELSPTGRVVLGLLASGPKSGYDIKTIVDFSTRFFWAASYGQIYPELKRLAEVGLIESSGDDGGARRRTTYRITAAGDRALAEWLAAPDLTHELRDEGLLKLFFAGHLAPANALAILRAKRDEHERVAEQFRTEIEPFAASAERFGPLEVLRYGIAYNEFAARWCAEAIDRIENGNQHGAFAAQED
jgi:DNA-binding PadR family transcriptional regulator